MKKLQPVQTSQSIDASPVNYQKYVGEKISAPPPSVAQCPRQPGWGACISKEQANDRFRNCCARLGDGCSALCHYDATLATVSLECKRREEEREKERGERG